MKHFIYFFFTNYNKVYLIYNILFWSIYLYTTIKEIKDDWIIIS